MKTVHKEVENEESTIDIPPTGKKSINEDVPKTDETPTFRQGSIQAVDNALEGQNKTSEAIKKAPKKNIHKRRKCEQCEKQFNKKET